MVRCIKLLTFDLDDTLWPCAPTIIAAEQELHDWFRQNIPSISGRYDIPALRQKRLELLAARPDLVHDMSALRIASFKQLSDEFELDDGWIDTAFDVFYQARQRVSLFPDVAPVLDGLSARYTLAAVSNGNASIELTGVSKWFDFAVSAAEVGEQKPHPLVFETAMRRASASPQETVHIGDDAHHDVFGAAAAGIRTVWVNRSQSVWRHKDCEADYHVYSLAELPDILQQIEYNAACK